MSIKCLPAFYFAAVCCSAMLGAFVNRASAAAAANSEAAGRLTRVTARFEVGGDLRLPGEPKPAALPMSVVARFDYFERRIDDDRIDDQRRSLRWYSTAEAAIKVDKQASVSKLAADHRLIRMALSKDHTTLAVSGGYLTRQERDLIDLPCNTLVLNKLLPTTSKKGSTRKPPEGDMALLLGLDAVSRSDVETTVSDLNNEVGEVTISGALDGAVGGVATEIEIKGKMHYDVAQHQPFALALLIKEKRTAGHVSPGLDVVAKLELQIAPVAEVKELSDEALGGATLVTEGPEPPLEFLSAESGFQFVYEHRWRITREERDAVVMRLVDRGDLVAQCNVSMLPKLDENQRLTLEEFQKEVQQSLGKHFDHLESAGERKTAAGLRMLHVVAGGAVSDLQIEWHYYLLIDPAGRRAAISFTMEKELTERFGNAARLIVDEFRFDAGKGVDRKGEDAKSDPAKSAARPRIRLTH
jgi:hypothetical protein